MLELKNPVTQTTSAFYEPSLDYVTLKVPRWDLTKFTGVSKLLGTQMKSVGEVMAIGRNFCEITQKAIRMVNENDEGITTGIFKNATKKELEYEIANPTNLRLFAIYEAFKRGYSIDKIADLSKISKWFLAHVKHLADTENELVELIKKSKTKTVYDTFNNLGKEYIRNLKKLGFSDYQLVKFFLTVKEPNKKHTQKDIKKLSLEIRKLRKKLNIVPVVKQIDTTSAEYPTSSNYLYLSYDGTHNDIELTKKKFGIITLGSGNYRIGSSCEFDWCSVMTSKYFKTKRADSIIINCNPETVSTDFSTSNRLYFEELSFERVLDIVDMEKPKGVIACMGGQNPNNLIPSLNEAKVKILGHSAKTVDMAEDRNKFSALLDKMGIDHNRNGYRRHQEKK